MLILSKEVKKIVDIELKDKSCEFAILATAEVDNEDWIIRKGVLCDRNEANRISAKISKILQYKLLKYCKNNNEIPILIHSHICYDVLEFSTYDTIFEEALYNIWKEENRNNVLISVLFGEKEYISRIWENNMVEPILITIEEEDK